MADKAPLLDRWKLLGLMMRDDRLNDGARRVAWAILDRVNSKTGTCWPSYERLMEDTGLSRAAVARAVKLLLHLRYFVHERGGGNLRAGTPGSGAE